MRSGIYKEVEFDSSHRLMQYPGKCANLHGHRWKVEVWIEGEPDAASGIILDYKTIKDVIHRFDHEIILNEADPMVPCIEKFQHVITTPGDPTSELLAAILRDDLNEQCRKEGVTASVRRIRVWESPVCYAELSED